MGNPIVQKYAIVQIIYRRLHITGRNYDRMSWFRPFFLSLRAGQTENAENRHPGESIPVVAIIFIFPPDWEQ